MKVILGSHTYQLWQQQQNYPKLGKSRDINGLQDLAYLVKTYNIPTTLIINTNQTCVHLVRTWGKRTWEMKKQKYIHVLGIKDKWQIIVSCNIIFG